jgi:hypothetical protein
VCGAYTILSSAVTSWWHKEVGLARREIEHLVGPLESWDYYSPQEVPDDKTIFFAFSGGLVTPENSSNVKSILELVKHRKTLLTIIWDSFLVRECLSRIQKEAWWGLASQSNIILREVSFPLFAESFVDMDLRFKRQVNAFFLKKGKKGRDLVLEVLAHSPSLTMKELVWKTGRSQAGIRHVLQRLLVQGKVQRVLSQPNNRIVWSKVKG